MSRHSRGMSASLPNPPKSAHTRNFSSPPDLGLGIDTITPQHSPNSPFSYTPLSKPSLLSSPPHKPPPFPDSGPPRRKFRRLKPSQETVLAASHILLPVLNLALLVFIGIINHAYLFPTSIATSLPLRERGYGFYKGMVALGCFSSILVGAVNVYVIRITFRRSPRARRQWRFWKEYIFPYEVYIPHSLFLCFPKRRTTHWPWKRPGGRLKIYKAFAFVVLALAGSWGFLACLAFRDYFVDLAWENSCERGSGLGLFGGNTAGWDLMAEIRVVNEGRVQYDGKPEENEKWGTTSRITFYTKGRKWDYQMELVRRYDMGFGFGEWSDGVAQTRNMETDQGQGLTRDGDDGVLVLALSNFVGSDNPEFFKHLPFMKESFTPRIGSNGTSMFDFSPYPSNSTSTVNPTAIAAATPVANISTASVAPTPTPVPPLQPLSSLKNPFLSSADRESAPLIINPFPIFSPPHLHSDEYRFHSPYPPIQKVVYYLSNMTYHLFLTNTTAPGFPAIEERGGFTLGPFGGRRFGVALKQTQPTEKTRDKSPWLWDWPRYDWEMNDGNRWRFDDFRLRPSIPRKDAGACLPPRVTMRKTGIVNDVLGVFGVTKQCGVLRVCGVRKGNGRVDLMGGKDANEEGNQGWESGGWKRDVEERWALVLGLISWDVERWAQCCFRGE